MKRSKFLKSLLYTGIAASIPVSLQAKSLKEEYKFDEIFTIHENNKRLIYPNKNSEIYKYIKNSLGDRIKEGPRTFRAYLPKHEVLIPIKETYTKEDFLTFIRALEGVYLKNDTFSVYEKDVFFRCILNDSNTTVDTMYVDLFLSNQNK